MAPAAIQQLVLALKHTKNEELDCEDVYNLIDQYVELTLQGKDTQELLPLVYHHLEMCRDCREEYETLKDILSSFPEN
jgi:predicted anti-sigma-YlaC factor YlaD